MNPRMLAVALLAVPGTVPAQAENLFAGGAWPALSADRRAAAPGETLTILIFQSAEASNSAQSSSRRDTEVAGQAQAGSNGESARLAFGGGYAGRGETRRSERLVAQITVTVREVLPNGDLLVEGQQSIRVNGNLSRIGVRGRIRSTDISRENTVLSARIADAEIDYDGQGFVARSARPSFINQIFSFLGIG